MCPGGRVVAATSEPGRVVTNGMSQYSRAEFNANSGLVVGIDPERDYPGHPLAGIDLQAPVRFDPGHALGGLFGVLGDRLVATVRSRPGPREMASCDPAWVSFVRIRRDGLSPSRSQRTASVGLLGLVRVKPVRAEGHPAAT